LITYRTERRIVSGNDSSILGDVLGRRRLGMLVNRRRRRRLRRLVSAVVLLRLLVIVLTTGNNCGGKRRSGRHELNETHVCGINEGQEDPKFKKLLS
jgi:hypothetical protein